MWTEFWARCTHTHVQQHLLFAEVERAKGRIPIFVSGEVDGKIICMGVFSIRPLFWGNKYSLEAVCLRGPAFDNIAYGREFILQIIKRFKSLKVGAIRISPYWVFPEAEVVEKLLKELGFTSYSGGAKTRTSTGLVNIQRSDDEMLASFAKNARREIRRAQRQEVCICSIESPKEAENFYQNLDRMLKNRGVIRVSKNEFRATYENILKNQELGNLLAVYKGSTFLGGLWIIGQPHTAHGHRFVVVPEELSKLSNLSISPILWWEGMKWARDKGCRWLNVEGPVDITNKSDPLYQIHKYKRRFNPMAVKIIAQHVYVCNSTIYALNKGCDFFFRGSNFAKSLPYQLKKRHLFSFGKNGRKERR